jgi:hypothetical protein
MKSVSTLEAIGHDIQKSEEKEGAISTTQNLKGALSAAVCWWKISYIRRKLVLRALKKLNSLSA